MRPLALLSIGVVFGVAAVGASPAFGQCRYDVTVIEPPAGGCISWSAPRPRGLNDAGTVVGYLSPCDQPFRWSRETGVELLPTPGWPARVFPREINDAGAIVGTIASPSSVLAFVFENEAYTILPPAEGGTRSSGYCVNRSGLIAGSRTAKDSSGAFIWSRSDGFTDLAIDRTSSWDLGSSYIWIDGQAWDLNDFTPPHVHVGEAWDINELGEIVSDGFVMENAGNVGVGLLLSPIDRPRSDLNGDCRVDDRDLARMFADWGLHDSPYDLDGGGVGFSDLTVLLRDWSG